MFVTAIHPDEGRLTRSKYRWETKNILFYSSLVVLCLYMYMYIYILIAQKWQRNRSEFVKDQWNVSQDSLIHACSLSASSFAKIKHFSRYNHPHILRMSSKAFKSDERLLCDIDISGKTQNYCLKSVCNFQVTRFYLILLCKQHTWTLGT